MRKTLPAGLALLACCTLTPGCGPSAVKAPPPPRPAPPPQRYLDLPSEELRPERSEAFLRDHPEDRAHREAALVWYHRRQPDLPKLEQHTLKMVGRHPDDEQILTENASAFYADPAYRAQVLAALELKAGGGRAEAGTYFNVARVAELGAVPPSFPEPGDRERFLRYRELPTNTRLPERLDPAGAAKAVDTYRASIRAAQGDAFHAGLYSASLGRLLLRLGRPGEAAEVCASALARPDRITRADLRLTRGRALRANGRLADARRELERVRQEDDEWSHGPGHATMDAEAEIGAMALAAGSAVEASQHLLASTNVQRCPHIWEGTIPLPLARRLLAAGQAEAVIRFCERALKAFGPDGLEQTQALLREARQSRGRPRAAPGGTGTRV